MAAAGTSNADDLSSASEMVSEIIPPVTAAIDFGTTSSGFAFAFQESLDDVKLNKWVQGSSDKDKAPTTVLLNEDKSFHSFGFDAELDYARLCEDKKQKGWRYFHHFKMALYRNEKINRYMKIYDTEDKPMPAIEVLSVVIRHLKEEILNAVRVQRTNILDDDVKYVMTVPAIWSDAAKQLMREAATHETVGILSDQLRLVLEPEAASVYCALRQTEKRKGSCDGQDFQSLPVGSTYIIVDIGGGTLDIATHEILPGHRLHEIYVARGNNMGGLYFNIKCLEFLTELFGKNCFKKWKETSCDDFLDMERTIEEMKRMVGRSYDDVRLDIDESLLELFEKDHLFSWLYTKSIDNFESMKQFKHAIKCSQDNCIVLKNEFLREFVKQIVIAIENFIREIINEVPSIETVFMVGGLAKSTFVRQYIEDKFPKCRVIVPEDPGVAVLKGAVLLGNRPETIASRVARFSYGIRVRQEFLEGKHREEYKINRKGRIMCENVFEKLIEKGQVLKYGQRFTTTLGINAMLPETKQAIFYTHLYHSTQPSPMYVTEDGCFNIGGFEMHPPEGGWPDYCEGGTLDIATHEILPGHRLHEIYVARGNDIAGHYFNIKCLEFLMELFGKDCFKKWKATSCEDFLDMERKIEEIKRKVCMRDDDVKLKLNRSLLKVYANDNVKFESMTQFKHAIKSSRKGCIILKNEFLRDFVKQVNIAIEKYIMEIITHVPSIKTIFMVGGLAKSTFVRQYIENQFPQCRVIVPEDPGVAVLKGAVLLGNRPQTIASRVARYSYGIAGMVKFVEGKHREEYKVTDDGEFRCKNVFEKLIEKGQVLQYGQRFTTTTHVTAVLPETKQITYRTYLYQSTQPSPMYVTEDGCCLLGGFEKHPPEGGWPDYCENKFEIIVGKAEFRLVLSDDIGRNYESKIDFLLP